MIFSKHIISKKIRYHISILVTNHHRTVLTSEDFSCFSESLCFQIEGNMRKLIKYKQKARKYLTHASKKSGRKSITPPKVPSTSYVHVSLFGIFYAYFLILNLYDGLLR